MSTGHDYTTEPAPSAEFNPDDYSFLPLSAAPDVEAAEREAEARQFRDLTPGDHELFVKQIVGRPDVKLRTGFVRGAKVSWESAMVKVRLARVGDPGASCVDMFDLPPVDPRGQEAYLCASKGPEGGNPGFHARKLAHFLSRLGFPFAEGAPLPAEACRLGNWIGRHIHATIELERPGVNGPTINQQTGLPYPPRSQVKLFSYRAAEQTIRGQVPAPHAGQQAAQQAAPQRAAATAQAARQPAPAGYPNQLATSGLNDL